jgi:hypothetical protein
MGSTAPRAWSLPTPGERFFRRHRFSPPAELGSTPVNVASLTSRNCLILLTPRIGGRCGTVSHLTFTLLAKESFPVFSRGRLQPFTMPAPLDQTRPI